MRTISNKRLRQLQAVGAKVVVRSAPEPVAPPLPPTVTAPSDPQSAGILACLRELHAVLSQPPPIPAPQPAPRVVVDMSGVESVLAGKKIPVIKRMRLKNVQYSRDRISGVDIDIETELQ